MKKGKMLRVILPLKINLPQSLVSFITNQPAQETIQVIENSELLYITHDDFRHLMTIIP